MGGEASAYDLNDWRVSSVRTGFWLKAFLFIEERLGALGTVWISSVSGK